MTITINGTTGIASPGGDTSTSLTTTTLTATNLTSTTVNGITVGKGAGSVSTNTAVGASALTSNSSGSNNTAVGYQTSYSGTTGAYVTAVGAGAGYSNTANSYATFIGYHAGYSSTGNGGFNLSTFVGYGAGSAVTTGVGNTILGAYSGNQGGLDIRTASNYIVLSDGDGNPHGWCNGSAWVLGIGGTSAVNTGSLSLQGAAASGYGPILLGYANNVVQWFAGSNSQIKGGTAYSTYTITAGGTSGGVNLTSGATSWASASDARLKNVTGTYENALSAIAQIEAVKFTWKDDTENKPQVGVIAQSVQAVVPEAIDMIRVSKEDETEYLSVKYTELIPLMIASIQELKADLDATKAELATLKGQA